ncbi:uncharacterized protein [Henckelia pumila]|uniref:uncharacterized protein n=1 Tax=Henckelia pumila TaxID=405737 RepID=UPI003C6DC13C
MATLHLPAPASHSAGAVRRIYAGTQAALSFDGFFPARCTSTSVAHVNIRIKNEARTKVKERWCPIFASKTNPPEESNIAKTSDPARGPPFLTILAGVAYQTHHYGECEVNRLNCGRQIVNG